MSSFTCADDNAIDAVNLSKQYGDRSVLRDVNLQVRTGECVYLVGPSGSGKSTLLSILGCILAPDEGSVRILGAEISRLMSHERARFRREQLGFVFQRFNLIRGLNVLENVRVAFDLLKWPAARAKKASYDLLEQVGLADRAASSLSELSMGQRQRVALARALAGSPRLILADEPTASLDAETGLAAVELLKTLVAANNTTVVIVTHDPRIRHVADRIYELVDGRIAENIVDADAKQLAAAY